MSTQYGQNKVTCSELGGLTEMLSASIPASINLPVFGHRKTSVDILILIPPGTDEHDAWIAGSWHNMHC